MEINEKYLFDNEDVSINIVFNTFNNILTHSNAKDERRLNSIGIENCGELYEQYKLVMAHKSGCSRYERNLIINTFEKIYQYLVDKYNTVFLVLPNLYDTKDYLVDGPIRKLIDVNHVLLEHQKIKLINGTASIDIPKIVDKTEEELTEIYSKKIELLKSRCQAGNILKRLPLCPGFEYILKG